MHPVKRLSTQKLLACLALVVSVALAAAKPPVQGLIWRATSKTATLYLVGSIHFGTSEMYPLPPIYQVAFDQASVLVEEIKDPDNFAAIGPIMQKYAMYPAGDSLSKHLKPATLDKLKEYCIKNAIPFERMDQLRPWVVSLLIPMMPMLKAADTGGAASPGSSPFAIGIDAYFAKKAHEAKKPIVGVETLEQQVKLIMGLAPDDIDKTLMVELRPQSGSHKLDDLAIVKDWTKGDAVAAAEAIGEAHLPRALLEDRNHRMADVCDSYLKANKPCLLVVGAGHMVGKEGIVELLRAKGYRVEQILSPHGN